MSKPQSEMEEFKSKLILLSKNIGKDWKILGRRLLLEEPELENIENNYPADSEEKAYQMLLLWSRRQKSPAHDALVSALEQVPRMDLIEMIKPSTTSIFY